MTQTWDDLSITRRAADSCRPGRHACQDRGESETWPDPVNKVILIGNLGRDPPRCAAFPPGGKGLQPQPRDQRDLEGPQHGRAQGADRVASRWRSIPNRWCALPNNTSRRARKCILRGQLETRKWQDQSGQDRYTTEIALRPYRSELTMLDSRGDGGGGGGYGGGGYSDDRGSGGFPDDRGGSYGGGGGGGWWTTRSRSERRRSLQGSHQPLARGWTIACKRLANPLQGICASGDRPPPCPGDMDRGWPGMPPAGIFLERRGAAVRRPVPGAQGCSRSTRPTHAPFHPR